MPQTTHEIRSNLRSTLQAAIRRRAGNALMDALDWLELGVDGYDSHLATRNAQAVLRDLEQPDNEEDLATWREYAAENIDWDVEFEMQDRRKEDEYADRNDGRG